MFTKGSPFVHTTLLYFTWNVRLYRTRFTSEVRFQNCCERMEMNEMKGNERERMEIIEMKSNDRERMERMSNDCERREWKGMR